MPLVCLFWVKFINAWGNNSYQLKVMQKLKKYCKCRILLKKIKVYS